MRRSLWPNNCANCVDVCALHPQPTRCCMSQIMETKINDFDGLTSPAKCGAHLIVSNVFKEFICGFRIGVKRQRPYGSLSSLVEINNAALAILGSGLQLRRAISTRARGTKLL